jgi:hypothetical protein
LSPNSSPIVADFQREGQRSFVDEGDRWISLGSANGKLLRGCVAFPGANQAHREMIDDAQFDNRQWGILFEQALVGVKSFSPVHLPDRRVRKAWPFIKSDSRIQASPEAEPEAEREWQETEASRQPAGILRS